MSSNDSSLPVWQMERIKELEAENRRLARRVSDLYESLRRVILRSGSFADGSETPCYQIVERRLSEDVEYYQAVTPPMTLDEAVKAVEELDNV